MHLWAAWLDWLVGAAMLGWHERGIGNVQPWVMLSLSWSWFELILRMYSKWHLLPFSFSTTVNVQLVVCYTLQIPFVLILPFLSVYVSVSAPWVELLQDKPKTSVSATATLMHVHKGQVSREQCLLHGVSLGCSVRPAESCLFRKLGWCSHGDRAALLANAA